HSVHTAGRTRADQRLRSARPQPGTQPRQGGRRRCPGSSAHAPRPALERRYELHVRGGRDARAAGGAAENLRASTRRIRRRGTIPSVNFSLSPEQQSFVDRIRAFARDRVAPEAAAIDVSGAFPHALVKEAAALGLAGVTIPKEHGGLGRDYLSYALAIEALAYAGA